MTEMNWRNWRVPPSSPLFCGKILQTVFDTLTSVTSGKYGDLRRLMVPSISPLKASIMKFYSKYCGCKHTPSRKKSDILNQSVLKWNWTQKSLCLCLNQRLNFRKKYCWQPSRNLSLSRFLLVNKTNGGKRPVD